MSEMADTFEDALSELVKERLPRSDRDEIVSALELMAGAVEDEDDL
jgi:hypothetical protein